MNTAKRKAKVDALMVAMKGEEPIVTIEHYTIELNKALAWYSEHSDERKLRKYAIEYFAKQKKQAEVLAINKATDFEIRQIGIICRLLSRQQQISDLHISWLDKTMRELMEKYSVPKEDAKKKTAVVINIQDRIDESAKKYAAEIDAEIDLFVLNKSSSFETKNFLLANSISAPVAKRIGEFYIPTLNEINEVLAGDDEQLVEGYSNFTKRELKKYLQFVESIIQDCQQQVQTAKAARSPRKRKPASPIKVVAKMKYMKEFAELNLKSSRPENILTSSELWVYNTKYRRIQVYKAEMDVLGVKGTTIIGFNLKDSLSYTLRKPEEFFKDLSLSKRALNSAIKKLTTKPGTPNGRINEECILLGAF
jgi:hypothetical protein